MYNQYDFRFDRNVLIETNISCKECSPATVQSVDVHILPTGDSAKRTFIYLHMN
jgi:hypothetical protein